MSSRIVSKCGEMEVKVSYGICERRFGLPVKKRRSVR